LARAGTSERWPAAVSPLTAAALQAPPRRARVLAALPTALYLLLPEGHEQVLPVLAADALRLPTGLRLATPSAELAWGVDQGDDVVVGDGCVGLPAADVVAVRTWRPARVSSSQGDESSPVDAARLRATLALLGPATEATVLRELTHDVATAALLGRTGRVGRLVRGLVGAGRGLTPSGDDALCGVLLGLRAAGAPAAAWAEVAAAVESSLAATTSLSASLLLAATDGYAVPEVVTVVEAVVRGDGAASARALPGVLAIGHSSGADLLAGLAGTLDVLRRSDLDLPSSDNPHPQPEGARRA
jgi:hypothetical protein